MRWTRLGFVSAVCLLLGFVGCNDSTAPLEVQLPSGRIQGNVRTGDIPTDMIVLATRVDRLPGTEFLAKARVASDGFYWMDIPAGRYVLGLGSERETAIYEYAAAGLVYGNAPPDTLLVDDAHSPVVVDFDLASMRVQLDVSAHLNREWGYVRLYRRDTQEPTEPGQRTYVRDGSAEIQNGKLVVELGGVLPGQYRVAVVLARRLYRSIPETPYDGEYLWVPGVRDSSNATWVDVAAKKTTDVSASLDGPPGRIQGVIRGAWQDVGLQQPSLALVNVDSHVVRGFRIVGYDGTFDEEIYLPEPVKLAVRHDGLVRWIGGDSFDTAQLFDLAPGSVVSGIEFLESSVVIGLQPPYTRVDFPSVRFFDAGTMILAAEWRPFMSGWGPLIAVGNLEPGTYLLQIEPYRNGWIDEWIGQWYDRVRTASASTPITIGIGETVRLDVTLERGGAISGTVRSPESGPRSYGFVITTSSDRAVWSCRFVSGATGTYTIAGFPDGDWKLGVLPSISCPDEAPPETVWFPGTTAWESAGVVTISGFGDVTGVDIVMPAQSP